MIMDINKFLDDFYDSDVLIFLKGNNISSIKNNDSYLNNNSCITTNRDIIKIFVKMLHKSCKVDSFELDLLNSIEEIFKLFKQIKSN